MALAHNKLDQIIEKLRALDIKKGLCFWKLEKREKVPHKVAFRPQKAPITEYHGTTIDDIEGRIKEKSSLLNEIDGIGIILQDKSLLVIDIDSCITEDGTLPPDIKHLMATYPTYAEKSPSGKGIHLLFRTSGGISLPKTRYALKDSGRLVEVYYQKRFITFTGDQLPSTPTELAELDQKSLLGFLGSKAANSTGSTGGDVGLTLILTPDAEPPKEKFEALMEIEKFRLTWLAQRTEPEFQKADGSPDWSSYDLSLATQAFKKGLSDQEVVNLLIKFRRQHNANPQKAQRPDYITRTLQKAKGGDRGQLERLKESDRSLHIPQDFCRDGGLIEKGVNALTNCGIPTQYALPTVLCALAQRIGPRLTFGRTRCNIYVIKVGRTSSGKSFSDNLMFEGGPFNGQVMKKISSGQAIFSALKGGPKLYKADECGDLFKETNDPYIKEMKENLMELFNYNEEFSKYYADSQKNITINEPFLCMIGNATFELFEQIDMDGISKGLVPRVLIFAFDGMLRINTDYMDKIKEFHQDLERIQFTEPTELTLSSGAKQKYEDYLDDYHEEKESLPDWELALTGKFPEILNKLIIIYHVSQGHETLEVTPKTVELAHGLTKCLTEYLRTTFLTSITTGPFHQDCEIFKAGIWAANKRRRRATLSAISDRKPQIKNWPPRHVDEVIQALRMRREIEVVRPQGGPEYFILYK